LTGGVEHVDRPQVLRLRAEMRLPGRAWLELSALPDPGGARYRQRAIFKPQGLAGHLYWQSIAPFHGLIFGGMARNITGAAEHQSAPTQSGPSQIQPDRSDSPPGGATHQKR
jgi:hypothetical protein